MQFNRLIFNLSLQLCSSTTDYNHHADSYHHLPKAFWAFLFSPHHNHHQQQQFWAVNHFNFSISRINIFTKSWLTERNECTKLDPLENEKEMTSSPIEDQFRPINCFWLGKSIQTEKETIHRHTHTDWKEKRKKKLKKKINRILMIRSLNLPGGSYCKLINVFLPELKRKKKRERKGEREIEREIRSIWSSSSGEKKIFFFAQG